MINTTKPYSIPLQLFYRDIMRYADKEILKETLAEKHKLSKYERILREIEQFERDMEEMRKYRKCCG